MDLQPTKYFELFKAKCGSLEADPAQLLPQLLLHLQALGELAKQISEAMGGNGHRPEAVTEIVSMLSK